MYLSFDLESEYGARIYFTCGAIQTNNGASSRIDLPDNVKGKVTISFDGENYKVFINDVYGNCIYSDDGVYGISGLLKFRLTFYSMVAGAKMKIDNLVLKSLSYPEPVVTEISRNNGNITLSLQRNNENIYVASYEEGELLSVKHLTESEAVINLDEKKLSKVFVWSKDMTPLIKKFKFEKGND